ELGCVDYLLAPFSEAQLSALLRRQESASAGEEGFVSCSQAGRRLLAMAQRVAMTRAPILITGETGTGKELMARYIHRFSAQDDAPFIAVNCAAIPEQMLESILFGHEKGAFTGAVSAQPGKFELANGGTLLLDEIGELPLGLQAKLLRVLQEQRVERLGGRREIALDVRIIAATNRDLQQEVAEGRFRADLMFRLDVLPLHISPLRERKEDVLALARRFIRQYAPQDARHELLTEDACRALLAHDWPGNVRELENCLQRALILRNGLYIQAQDLGLSVPVSSAAEQAPRLQPQALEGGKAALRASGKWAEYQHVIDTIRRFGGHKTKAAESLGMTPRALRYRLNAMREQGVQIPV
ncbi:MAG: sigma-54 interaction domain-containing protein, partial [Pseudomonadaceae bacterium]